MVLVRLVGRFLERRTGLGNLGAHKAIVCNGVDSWLVVFVIVPMVFQLFRSFVGSD
jgi:hypothetical protein